MAWDKEPRAWRVEDGSYLDLDCAVMYGGVGAAWAADAAAELQAQKNALMDDGLSHLPYAAGGYQARHCSEKRHGFVCSRPVIKEF